MEGTLGNSMFEIMVGCYYFVYQSDGNINSFPTDWSLGNRIQEIIYQSQGISEHMSLSDGKC